MNSYQLNTAFLQSSPTFLHHHHQIRSSRSKRRCTKYYKPTRTTAMLNLPMTIPLLLSATTTTVAMNTTIHMTQFTPAMNTSDGLTQALSVLLFLVQHAQVPPAGM